LTLKKRYDIINCNNYLNGYDKESIAGSPYFQRAAVGESAAVSLVRKTLWSHAEESRRIGD
jgi:hypothetical protein